MAVTDAEPGVTVEIVVNGEALREYRYDEEDESTTSKSTCYVEAQSGDFFEVRARVKQGTKCLGNRLTFYVSVDGRDIDNVGIPSSLWETKDASAYNSGRELSNGMVQRFCFADLTTSDDATSEKLASPAQIKGLGVIKVELHHKQLVKFSKAADLSAIAPAAFVSVPEKVLKGQSMSHSVELKSVQMGPLRAHTRARATFVDPEEKPAATYIFHYRSKASLQSMLLITRTPSPAPAEERKLNDMSRDELIQLVSQQRLLESQADANNKKIKRERVETSPIRRKVRRNNKVTTIELDDNGEIVRETVQPRSATPDPSESIELE